MNFDAGGSFGVTPAAIWLDPKADVGPHAENWQKNY